VETEWKQKKADYDKVILKSESEINQLETEVKKLKTDVYKDDTKISLLKYSQQILDLKLTRLGEEEKYQKGEKSLSSTYKSYVEQFNGEVQHILEVRRRFCFLIFGLFFTKRRENWMTKFKISESKENP